MDNLENYLLEHPFFKGLQREKVNQFTGCAINVRFNAGEFIGREGEKANQLYLVRHGRVALEINAAQRGTITIQTLGAGEILGWSWLILPYRWHFDIRAIDLTRLVALDATCLRSTCESDKDLGYELMKRIAYVMEERLKATRLQLIDMYGKEPAR